MNYSKCTGFMIFLLSLTLLGCSKDLPPGDYDSAEVGQIKKVVPGVIIGMRPVRLHSKANEALNTSNPIEQSNADVNINRTHGYEYVIRLNSGSIISVVQAENIKLKTKQHVLVVNGPNTRVMPDDGSDDY